MIDVRALSIRLGEFTLSDINMHVNEGAYFVILGPTGAGKTVLLECIVGLYQPSAGVMLLEGRDVTNLRPEERHVAYVPQDYSLFPHMTIRDNIAFGMRLRKWPRRQVDESVESLSELLHISGLLGRRPLTLSGGEKQRAALARALAIRPKVLLLDEPLAAVDERTRERLCDELKTVQREFGTTTIHVSHNFEETLAVADEIAIFQAGRIVQIGTPHEVFHHPADEFVAAFTGIQNVFPGQVTGAGGGWVFKIGELAVPVARATAAGACKLTIRPEAVRLHPAGDVEGIAGAVTRLTDKGPMVKAFVQAAGLQWAALLSKTEAANLNLQAGDSVSVILPPEAIHLIF